MRNQEVIFGVTGQSFFYDPPEGRPTGTPTVGVFTTGTDDDGTAESATTGVCSVDPVNTTLSDSASAGATSLSLASGASVIKGRRYLLTDSDGDSELVEVISINGTTVGVRQNLINDYASGSTFVGTRITMSVDATWVSTKAKITDVLGEVWRIAVATPEEWAACASGYRLRWAYVVGGVNLVGVSFADLVRYPGKNLVTPLDVDRRIPGWIDRLPTDYRRDQGAALVEEAYQAVRFDALGDAKLLRRVRNTEVLAELVKYRANILACEANVLANGSSTDTVAILEVARDLYAQRYNQLLREPQVPVDNTGGGSNGQADKRPLFVR